MAWWREFQVDVPEGVSGTKAIRKFRVEQVDVDRQQMRAAATLGRERVVPLGTYTSLVDTTFSWTTLWMSDTPDEIRSHLGPIQQVERCVRSGCKPRVLVHGLGIGMVARAVLKKGAVHCTVIENNGDVIKLVAPWLRNRFGDRVEIIEADALTWKPPRGARWDVVWHDIWPNICADNLKTMNTLHRRFGRRADWQGSWERARVQHYARGGW